MNKKCDHCGKTFTPNHRLGAKRIATTRFCSQACARASQRTVAERLCAACGTIFTPRNRRGKYCNLACAASAHKGPVATKGKGERYKRVAAPDGTRQLEHRVVMSKILGRPLEITESVHHKNGDRFDNSPENLELWYKAQPAGQRVVDLIAYVVEHHTEAVRSALRSQLSNFFGEPGL